LVLVPSRPRFSRPSSPEDGRDVGEVWVRVAVTMGAAGARGVTGSEPSGEGVVAGGAEPVMVEPAGGAAECLVRLAVCDRVCVGRVATAGASRLPAEIGSEARPMCWLVSWPVAQVMPAVSAMPSSAANAHNAA